MTTNVETRTQKCERLIKDIPLDLKQNYNPRVPKLFLQSIKGFAMILDDAQDKCEIIDIDLVDIQMVLGMQNGTTIQLTGQVTDIQFPGNSVIQISTADRRNNISPRAVYIFRVTDIISIQSYDVVSYLKNKEKQDALNVLYPENDEQVVKEPENESEQTN